MFSLAWSESKLRTRKKGLVLIYLSQFFVKMTLPFSFDEMFLQRSMKIKTIQKNPFKTTFPWQLFFLQGLHLINLSLTFRSYQTKY